MDLVLVSRTNNKEEDPSLVNVSSSSDDKKSIMTQHCYSNLELNHISLIQLELKKPQMTWMTFIHLNKVK